MGGTGGYWGRGNRRGVAEVCGQAECVQEMAMWWGWNSEFGGSVSGWGCEQRVWGDWH